MSTKLAGRAKKSGAAQNGYTALKGVTAATYIFLVIGWATLTLTHFFFFFFACCAAAAALLSVGSPRGRLAAGGGTAMFSRSVRASKVCCSSPRVFLDPFFNEGIVSLSAASSFLSCAESRSVQCSESCEDIISTNASACSRLYCFESDTPPFAPYKKVSGSCFCRLYQLQTTFI